MKVAIYLPNAFCDIDCTNIKAGNPGIGGTEYMIITLSYYLSCEYRGDHQIYLLAQQIKGLPKQINIFHVANVNEAIHKCYEEQLECLVFQGNPETIKVLDKKIEHSLSLILWSHSFLSRRTLTKAAKCPNVKRIVCVGNEELDLYIDHKAYFKSVVIFNAFPLKIDKSLFIPFDERKNEVVFLASIVPHTNFHLLAAIWEQVVKEVPDAHLSVIGSGNVYNSTIKMGKWNIAKEEYEKTFINYLLNEKREILSSVTFWGKMGNEKYAILGRAKVGVANPGGYETFCISALEMQLYGALVTSIKKGGCVDTVFCTDNLYSNIDYLADYIVALLRQNDNEQYEHFIEYAEENFSFKKICAKWNGLFDDIENKREVRKNESIIKRLTFGGRLRRLNKKMKDIVPFGYEIFPSYMFYHSIFKRIKRWTNK